jgi:hypothetical protein
MPLVSAGLYTHEIEYKAEPSLAVGSCSFRTLVESKYHAAQNGNVMSITGSALPFWLSLGLDPVSGSKDLWPYVVYEQDTVCISDIMQWIQHMSKAFDVSGLKVIVVEQALSAGFVTDAPSRRSR